MKRYLIPMLATALIAMCGCNEAKLPQSGLDPKNFESVVDGKPVALYTLSRGDIEVCITNYGGRIVSLMVPDRTGTLQDVVLGHASIADYLNIDGNFGAIIGRYGNRIDHGRFTLDSVEYQLPQNNYGHCLHGGDCGFHHAVWDVAQHNDTIMALKLYSPDGYEGFPGNLDVTVTYHLMGDNVLTVTYEAETDKPTIINLTNHSYFNLSGDPSHDILGEIVRINADGFTPIDSTFMTTGEIRPVEGTPFDFRVGKPVGQDINIDDEQLHNGLGYDHNFVLNNSGNLINAAAMVIDIQSGIQLELLTTEPGLQFYVGNFLDGTVKGKHGIAYPQRSAICLEPQHYPDSPNKPEWPSVVLRPGEKYSTTTIYRFSVAL